MWSPNKQNLLIFFFQALIERDWLAFGHKFTERFGHLAGDAKEISPVLTQFIDATWQLWNIFPTVFQFNERFLLTIHDHAASCQFGTFIGNCEKDRIDLRYLYLKKKKMKSQFYFPYDYKSKHVAILFVYIA